MGRKRHLYDTAKLNSSTQSNMTDRQKSFSSSDSASFAKDECRGSKHNISPLQIPVMIPTFVADLTPTPTRFLRSCDEVGLFNEISKSSYNEDFKRQNSTYESNSVLSSLHSHCQAPIPSVILESIADDNEVEDEASAAAVQNQSTSNFAISNIVETSSQQLIYSASQESAADTTAEVAMVEPPAERPHIQVLLQLPQGGFIPINIPTDALAHATFPASPAMSVATPLVVAPEIATTTSSTSGITSSTKQKLKAAVQQNIQQQQQQQQQQLTHQQQHLQPIALAPSSVDKVALPDISSSSSSSLRGSGPSTSKTPKLSLNMSVVPPDIDRTLSQPLSAQSSDDDESEEKRKKFLESNRAAANRCRQKKKQWINSLEEKTKQLQDVNRSLTNETAQLRREITNLKQLLSQHKDCPQPLTIITSNVRTDSSF